MPHYVLSISPEDFYQHEDGQCTVKIDVDDPEEKEALVWFNIDYDDQDAIEEAFSKYQDFIDAVLDLYELNARDALQHDAEENAGEEGGVNIQLQWQPEEDFGDGEENEDDN